MTRLATATLETSRSGAWAYISPGRLPRRKLGVDPGDSAAGAARVLSEASSGSSAKGSVTAAAECGDRGPQGVLRRELRQSEVGGRRRARATMEEGGPAERAASEDQAPEGGWGWCVALGMSVMFIVMMGPVGCFGLVFGEFLEAVGGGTQAFTVVVSVFVTSVSLTGLVTNYAMKEYSARQVGIAGCLLAFSGNFLSIFATSVNYLVITYGIVQGTGFGLMITPSFTAMNTYFIRRRNFAMGLAQILIGLGCMLYPLLISLLYSRYGFRGTQAVLTALVLHSLPAMATFQPVRWHMPAGRRGSTRPAEGPVEQAAGEPPPAGPGETERLLDQQSPALVENGEASPAKRRRSVADERGRNHSLASVDSMPVSLAAVLGHRGSGAPLRPAGAKTPARATALEKMVDFFDLKLLLDPVYVSISVGLSVAMVADMSFFSLLPVYLAHLGVPQEGVATCLSVGAACDLVSRVGLALLGLVATVDSRTLVLVGLVFTTVFRTVFIFYTDYVYLTVFTGIISIFRPLLLIELPLVFAEYCSLQRFPSAYGLFMIISGMLSLVFGPIVGVIRDVTGSYTICLHSLAILTMMCIVSWLIELFVMRFKWRRSLSQRILNLK
ncbi:monocarboxylate transporter 9-like isoform X1 [Bacillus rossius redtenbacheri]|uniref:monocarboxylate transporter 9-like isoform X1 n=1 Tax=Bacillus rossius redtenbacheri TaxID=93214 RepID=UPI002FDE7B03